MKQTVAGRWRSVQWVIHKLPHRAYKASLVETMSAKSHLYCMSQTMNPKIVAIQQLLCKAKRVIMHQLLTVSIFFLISMYSQFQKKSIIFSNSTKTSTSKCSTISIASWNTNTSTSWWLFQTKIVEITAWYEREQRS